MRLLTQGNTGSYTAAQLEAALTGPSALLGPRFEVYNLAAGNIGYLGDLTTVTAASVDVDATRLISGLLNLSFSGSDPILPYTTVPYTRLVKPWMRYGMPDGGVVEWPLGVYVWQPPKRRILSVDPEGLQEPIQTWDVTLGDQMTFLVIGGPGPKGWNINANVLIAPQIGLVLTAGMPYPVSTLGIESSTAVTSGPLTYLLLSSSNPKPLAKRQPAAPATSWATIAQQLHEGGGDTPPAFDDDGTYIAKAMPAYNLFGVDPDKKFVCDRSSIVETPIELVPKVEQVGNRVYIQANNGNVNALQATAIADADEYLPNHPFAHRNCGIYIDVTDTDEVAGEYNTLKAHSISTLYQRMAVVNEVSFTTQFWPGIERWDVLGLQVPGDPTYGTVRRLMATKWTTDLFTGRMQHKPATLSGA